MTKDDDDFQLYPCFNGLPSESLDDYTFEVEALVAGSKDDEKKLIGPRLVRRLGGVPGALARRELHMPDLAKPEGYKLILLFLEQKGYKKDALDKRLLANRRYEAVARRPGQTLQDFFATENMAYADAVKAGVGIDPDRRAYHMFIKSGLTDDQINHIYSFVYDPDAVGPQTALDPRKIQEAALRFYDKPWDVDRHRDSRASLGRYSRPLMGHAATTHRHQTSYLRSRAGNKGSYTQEPWEEETFPTEDGYEYNDWNESFSNWHQYSAEEFDDWEEEVDLETFLAGESDWIHRDVLDSDTLDSYVEEECSADKNLYEAYLGYKEARDILNQVRRGRGFWPVIAIPSPDGRSATLAVRANDESFRVKGKDSKGTTHKGKSKGNKSGKSGKNKGGKGKSSGKSNVKGKGDPLKQRLVSRTQCRMCGEEGHWEEDCPQADVDMPQAKASCDLCPTSCWYWCLSSLGCRNLDGFAIDRQC